MTWWDRRGVAVARNKRNHSCHYIWGSMMMITKTLSSRDTKENDKLIINWIYIHYIIWYKNRNYTWSVVCYLYNHSYSLKKMLKIYRVIIMWNMRVQIFFFFFHLIDKKKLKLYFCMLMGEKLKIYNMNKDIFWEIFSAN